MTDVEQISNPRLATVVAQEERSPSELYYTFVLDLQLSVESSTPLRRCRGKTWSSLESYVQSKHTHTHTHPAPRKPVLYFCTTNPSIVVAPPEEGPGKDESALLGMASCGRRPGVHPSSQLDLAPVITGGLGRRPLWPPPHIYPG